MQHVNPCSPDGSVGGLDVPELCCCTGTPWRDEGLCLLEGGEKKKKRTFERLLTSCLKSRLTSRRHLNVSFVRRRVPCVNAYVFVEACLNRSLGVFFPVYLIRTLNSVFMIVSVTYLCMHAACPSVNDCNDEEGK